MEWIKGAPPREWEIYLIKVKSGKEYDYRLVTWNNEYEYYEDELAAFDSEDIICYATFSALNESSKNLV